MKEMDTWEDLGADGMIILQWILKTYVGKVCNGFICLGIGRVAGSCEHNNEPLDSK
jgi:hypothetical protein